MEQGDGVRLSFAGVPAGRVPRRRLNTALVLSLLAHALLLSLTFGQGEGLPGLSLPWQARRADAPDLRVVLQPEPGVAAPLPSLLPDAESPAEPATASPAQTDALKPLKTMESADDVAPLPTSASPALLTSRRPDVATWAVPAASAVPTAVVAMLPAASGPDVEALRQAGEALRARSDREARERAADVAQLDIERQQAKATSAAVIAAFSSASSASSPVEPLRRAAEALRTPADREARERGATLSQLEAERQQAKALPTAVVATFSSASSPAVEPLRRAADTLRSPADRERVAELAQLDSARLDAQRSAQRLEAARLESARQEAARQEAARAEAGRQEAARQAAAKAAAQLEAGRIEAAKLAAVQAEAEQREARLRAIGKQLDEEAAKRDAARQQPNWTPARRGRLFGRTDANEELVLYAEAWARKLQFNPTFEMVRDAAKPPYTDPIVTVAVRSDGSVESVTFVRSSGVPALDDAVRRVVQSQERYPAFSPALLRDFDVVEIRRTWHFDSAIRLY